MEFEYAKNGISYLGKEAFMLFLADVQNDVIGMTTMTFANIRDKLTLNDGTGTLEPTDTAEDSGKSTQS